VKQNRFNRDWQWGAAGFPQSRGIVSTLEHIERDTAHLCEIMTEAAERVCGVAIPVSFEIVRYPDRYWDADDTDAVAFWHWMVDLLERVEGQRRAA
jgi:hypothetical protein